jgi:hypothetical protein
VSETKITAVAADVLETAIRRAWSAETSSAPDWTLMAPSRGQCAVTALLVQDYFGGDLLRAVVDGVSHYWNRINGDEIDFTRDQFGRFEITEIETRSRAYVLSFPDTLMRYELLKQRVQSSITENRVPART